MVFYFFFKHLKNSLISFSKGDLVFILGVSVDPKYIFAFE